jgi:hypothetical protein
MLKMSSFCLIFDARSVIKIKKDKENITIQVLSLCILLH